MTATSLSSSSPPPTSPTSKTLKFSSPTADYVQRDKLIWSEQHDTLLLQQLVAHWSMPDSRSVDWQAIAATITRELGGRHKPVGEGLVRSKAYTLRVRLGIILNRARTSDRMHSSASVPSQTVTMPALNSNTSINTAPQRKILSYTSAPLRAKSSAIAKLDNLAARVRSKQESRIARTGEAARDRKVDAEIKKWLTTRPKRTGTAEQAIQQYRQQQMISGTTLAETQPALKSQHRPQPVIKAPPTPTANLARMSQDEIQRINSDLFTHLRGASVANEQAVTHTAVSKAARITPDMSSRDIYETAVGRRPDCNKLARSLGSSSRQNSHVPVQGPAGGLKRKRAITLTQMNNGVCRRD